MGGQKDSKGKDTVCFIWANFVLWGMWGKTPLHFPLAFVRGWTAVLN